MLMIACGSGTMEIVTYILGRAQGVDLEAQSRTRIRIRNVRYL